MFNQFTSIVLATINKHAPLKPLSRKQKRLRNKPWITKEIHSLIRKRRSMFKSHFLQLTLMKNPISGNSRIGLRKQLHHQKTVFWKRIRIEQAQPQ